MWEAGGGKHHFRGNEVASKRMLLGGDQQDGLLHGGHNSLLGVEQQQGTLVVQGREGEAAGCGGSIQGLQVGMVQHGVKGQEPEGRLSSYHQVEEKQDEQAVWGHDQLFQTLQVLGLEVLHGEQDGLLV